MNLNADSRSSLEELKRRNELPQELPTVPLEPAEIHPTAEEWTELLEMISALYRMTAMQYDWMKSEPPDSMRKELMQAVKETAAIRTLLEQERRRREQVGKQNERCFLPCWPKLKLPCPSPVWLLVPLILIALWALWYGWGALWKGLSPMFM